MTKRTVNLFSSKNFSAHNNLFEWKWVVTISIIMECWLGDCCSIVIQTIIKCVSTILTNANDPLSKCVTVITCRYHTFNFSYEIVIEVSIDRYRMLHIATLFIWAYWLVRLPELWRPGYYYVIWFSIPNYNRPQHAGSRKCQKSIKSPLSTPWMLPGPLELPVDLFNKQFPLWFLAFGEGVRIPPNPS